MRKINILLNRFNDFLRTSNSLIIILVLSFLTLFYNIDLILYVRKTFEGGPTEYTLFTFSFIFLIYSLLNILYALIFVKYLHKILFPFFFIGNAISLYFIRTYNIMIDKTIMRSLFNTNIKESFELLNLNYLLVLFFLGLLPAGIYLLLKFPFDSVGKELKKRVIFILSNIIVVVTILFTMYQQYSVYLRNHREVKHLFIPINYLDGSKVLFTSSTLNKTLEIISSDAKLASFWNVNPPKKTVVVMVLGETARAQNYSLGGYQKKTNEFTEKIDNLIYFPHVTSCGTATAVSLPCLFSDRTRDQYSESTYRENLMDVVSKTGIEILWRDNNSGCQDVCNRVPTEYPQKFMSPQFCKGDDCYDEALLNHFDEIVAKAQDKLFIVLHILGSHGPSYYLRYPPQFKKFSPECQTEKLNTCSKEEIENAYDNTLLYTDHIVAKTIEKLKEHSDIASALIYFSDHGESLGEKNLYLHGIPYIVAPAEQTHIPMMFWASSEFSKDFKLDLNCLKEERDKDYSHDFIYHSMLGLLRIESATYDANLDFFRPCLK